MLDAFGSMSRASTERGVEDLCQMVDGGSELTCQRGLKKNTNRS